MTPLWKVRAAQQLFRASRVKGNVTHLKVDATLSMMFHVDCFRTPMEILERLRLVLSRDLEALSKQLDLLVQAKSESSYKIASSLLEESVLRGEGHEGNQEKKCEQRGL